jgi:hypothetical protein
MPCPFHPTWLAATCSCWFLARGFFYHEDGGDMLLRNVGSHKIYTAPHPRRRHSPLYLTSALDRSCQLQVPAAYLQRNQWKWIGICMMHTMFYRGLLRPKLHGEHC